jgi:acyl-coenzyme A thioesterase PaaI-like protein
VALGEVEIELPFRDDLTQHHGYLHAGIVTATWTPLAASRR